MFFLINILFIIFFIIFSKFFFKSKKNFSYIKISRVYFIFFFIFILLSIQQDQLGLNNSFNYLCLIMNIIFFISYLLTLGLRFVNSPSFYIIDYLK